MPLKSGRLAVARRGWGRRPRAVRFMSGSTLLRLKPEPADPLDLDHRAYDAGFTEPGLRKTLGVEECSTASPSTTTHGCLRCS